MQYIIVIYNSMSSFVYLCIQGQWWWFCGNYDVWSWKFWCLESGPGHSLLKPWNLRPCDPKPHQARGRSQKHTFHPIIVIVIMLKMTMIIINGDHQWWSFTPFNHFNFVSFVHTLVTNFVTLSYYHNDNDNDNIIIMIMIMIMIILS